MKKILLILVVGMFLINFVSAGDWFDFDNYKSYEKDVGEFGKVSIMDEGFFSDHPLKSLELKTNSERCKEYCSATKEIIMYEDDVLIQDIRFIDVNYGRRTDIKSYEIYVDGELYNLGDEVQGNSKGITYQVELQGELYPFQRIDWQVKTNNFWITEYAIWTSDLNTNLTHYYDFDTGSGVVLKEKRFGKQNGTLINSPSWIDGILSNGLGFGESTDREVNIPFELFNQDEQTITMWLNPNATFNRANNEYLFSSEQYSILRSAAAPSHIQVTAGGSTIKAELNASWWQPQTWIHLAVVFRTGGIDIYYNGTLMNTSTIAWSKSASENITIGSFYKNDDVVNALNYTGGIDEVGIWNGTLTALQIQAIYNNGVGISFNANPSLSLEVNLNSPTNNTITSTTTFNLTGSFALGEGTFDNATYYIWRDDNTLFNKSTFDVSNSINATNISFTGFTPDKYIWNIYPCGNNATTTLCEFATLNATFSVGAEVTAENYSINTTEGNSETFTANITTPSGYQLTEAILVYNNTNFAGTIVNTAGDNYTATRTIDVPSVSVDSTLQFFWNLKLQNNFETNSTQHNQGVTALKIDDCTTHSTRILNFTLRDEENQTILDGDLFNTTIEIDVDIFPVGSSTTILNFSNSSVEINPTSICINDDLSNSTYTLDATIRYSSADRETEYYHIQSFSLTNSTIPQNINLYDLLSVDSQPFLITFKDQNFLAVENALINIQRQYVGDGVFKSIEIPKTDNSGQAVAHLVLDNVVYTMIISKSGSVLGTFNNVVAICDDLVVGDCKINLNTASSKADVGYFYEEVNLFEWTKRYLKNSYLKIKNG